MQRTADFQDHSADARLPQAAGVMGDTAARDAPVDMLDADAATCHTPVRGFLRARQGTAPRLPGRHDALDLRQGEGQATQILEQPTSRR